MNDTTTTTWNRDDGDLSPRNVGQSILRGVRMRCPACGEGPIFNAYLKVNDACPACGEELHHHRADDAPPYFTIVIVGHIVVPLVLTVERLMAPSIWLQAAGWTLLTTILCLIVLPMAKGGLIGLQWANYMHGFDPRSGGQEDWNGLDPQQTVPPKSTP
jgi:uncharacterized protein (DUF983 family)